MGLGSAGGERDEREVEVMDGVGRAVGRVAMEGQEMGMGSEEGTEWGGGGETKKRPRNEMGWDGKTKFLVTSSFPWFSLFAVLSLLLLLLRIFLTPLFS